MPLPLHFPSGKTFDVVGFGVGTIDHVCVVSQPPAFEAKQRMVHYFRQPGGQVPTALVALQRWGLTTAFVGPFADDEGGRLQRAALQHEGVDVSGAQLLRGVESHVSIILVDGISGERGILWHRPAQLRPSAKQLDRRQLTAGRVLFMDAEDLDSAIIAARWAREEKVVVVLDTDKPGPGTDELFAASDVVVVPADFPGRFTGERDVRAALRKIGRIGPALVAVTLGRGGALVLGGRRIRHVPAFPARAVDTTAAGDLFHAGCIYALLQGWSVERVFRFAAAAAALECEQMGGLSAIPSLDRVHRLCNRRSVPGSAPRGRS